MTKETDIDILARTIYGEARGEPELGKKAIACVVMNRYKAHRYFSGATIAETCQKRKQFSCWNAGDPNRKVIENATATELAEYRNIAEKFISGEEKDFLCGACHYHAVGHPAYWAEGKTPDFQIGNHLFYVGIQ